MFILRVVALVCVAALLVALGLYAVTRDRRYLNWAWRIIQYSIVITVVVLVLYVLERLLVAV